MRTSRSVSMSNISIVTPTPTVPFVEKRPRSLSPHVYDSPPGHRLSY
ncbi:unnamed protein product, partial [Rotaria magnacalcarata]